MINENIVGNGKVALIAGGGKIWADVAARFARSERPMARIIESPYSPELLSKILEANHKSVLEFDYFLFAVEGYSRVCETQLVRKRHASYLIKSGRAELAGKRAFSVVLPASIKGLPVYKGASLNTEDLLRMLESWYNHGLELGIAEEDLRYLKPQATEFRAVIGMNAHALHDFFAVRCCRNAQAEIRDLANKMLALCKQAAPGLFQNAGPNCVQLGYCPENNLQHASCKGRVPTRKEALAIIHNAYNSMSDKASVNKIGRG